MKQKYKLQNSEHIVWIACVQSRLWMCCLTVKRRRVRSMWAKWKAWRTAEGGWSLSADIPTAYLLVSRSDPPRVKLQLQNKHCSLMRSECAGWFLPQSWESAERSTVLIDTVWGYYIYLRMQEYSNFSRIIQIFLTVITAVVSHVFLLLYSFE